MFFEAQGAGRSQTVFGVGESGEDTDRESVNVRETRELGVSNMNTESRRPTRLATFNVFCMYVAHHSRTCMLVVHILTVSVT